MSTQDQPVLEHQDLYGPLYIGKLLQRTVQVRKYLTRRWWKLAGFGLLFALLCTSYFFLKRPTYSAEMSFVLDEQASETAKNDLAGLPDGLGLQSIDPTGSVFSTLNNVVELIRSRLMLEKTLRSSVKINGKTLVLADFFLDSLEYREKWIPKSLPQKISFRADSIKGPEQLYVSGLLGRMVDMLQRKLMVIEKKGKGTSIIAVTCTSENELFSKYFVEALMFNTEQYYTETKTQRAKINLDFISRRTDSVKATYNAALYGRAVFNDENVNPDRQVGVVSAEKKQTDLLILRTAYIELTRNLEAAKSTLRRETPLFQYLDTPLLPLKKSAPPILFLAPLFFVLGVLLCGAYLLLKKWWSIMERNIK